MRWALKHRIEFIADRLATIGKVNRRNIMEKYGVSAPQASADFRTFEKARPGVMRYNSTLKAYILCHGTVATSGRDTSAAAKRLMYSDDGEIIDLAKHDPGMVRDVAAALLYERTN